MEIFVERYLLAITAGLTLLLIATNPMKFDRRQRISGSIALLCLSYFLAHTVQIKNRVKADTPEGTSQPTERRTGPATTFGDHSPANTGDGNTFIDGDAENKKPEVPK